MVNYLSTTSTTRGHYFYPLDDNYRERPRTSNKHMLSRWDNLNSMEWVPFNGTVPSNAVECAQAHLPRLRPTLYLSRAFHEGSFTPGFFNPASKLCYIPWGGKEHSKRSCEILCTPGEFVECSDKTLTLATPAGLSEQGEPLYIGRVKMNGEWIYGKVQRSHDVCYVPWKRKETNHKNYEIFIKSQC
uniref:DUF3421 domain-containing protein n=1 Tax=Anopheles dirus TaxID=7168 RepID=A0A182NUW5_9DIPT